jgi:hypothetical protein
MEKYLVGISYHESEHFESLEKGIYEDYESATAIFITANSTEEALAWGEIVAEELFKKKNPNESDSWKSFGHYCWIEEDWKESNWEYCLEFFRNINYGTHPDYEKIGIKAYLKWYRNN